MLQNLISDAKSSRGWISVLGGFLLCLSMSSDFSYPNINTYLTSYMRTNGYNPNLTYDDFVFLTTTKVILQGVSMPFVGHLCRIIGCRWSILIGSVIYSVGFMLTYFTIQSYFILAILSLSAHGLAFSFVYATAIGAAQKWFPKSKRGFVGSFVLSGYGFGSLIWVPLQTSFVNPDNAQAVQDPDCNVNVTDCDRYYTDLEMLERIPLMFLLLGAIYAVLGLVAVVMITEPEDSLSESNSVQETENTSEEDGSLRPLEVLRTSTFYQIWTGFFAVGLCNGLMSTFSKSFGLTFINDDHYFATVAIFQNIANGLCRIAWGFSYDKIGFKKCFIIIGSAVTLGTVLLPALPHLGEDTDAARAMYGVVMVLLYGTFPGIYAIVAAAVADAFGSLHYKANFGLLFTQSLAYSAVILTVTQVPVFHAGLGYTGVFLLAGACGVVGILTSCCLPRTFNPTTQKD